MKIKNIFKQKKLVFSLEVFPPKSDTPIDNIFQTLDQLKDIDPDYMSVTYGAGGGVNKNRTCEISSLLKNKYNIEPLAHLTCINSTKDRLNNILENLEDNDIENILALR